VNPGDQGCLFLVGRADAEGSATHKPEYPMVCLAAFACAALAVRRSLDVDERKFLTERRFAAAAAEYVALDNASEYHVNGRDLVWRDHPGAWHQQMARIVDHRFSTFAELRKFALDAKRAGVSALMLVQIQKTASCPGPWYPIPSHPIPSRPNAACAHVRAWWRYLPSERGIPSLFFIPSHPSRPIPSYRYNGLQLCDHINGSYPAADGSLAQWRAMLEQIKPMR
jgi:hypothetical protein